MDPRFAHTEYVVEATSAEKYFLWELHAGKNTWEQGSSGLVIEIGKLGGPLQEKRPIVICCWWERINGMNVLFWEATSQLVDYRMIEEWFKQNCYPYEHGSGRAAKTDAMNFHSCLYYSKQERPAPKSDGLIDLPRFYYRPPSRPL
jgi:hypothetical protein